MKLSTLLTSRFAGAVGLWKLKRVRRMLAVMFVVCSGGCGVATTQSEIWSPIPTAAPPFVAPTEIRPLPPIPIGGNPALFAVQDPMLLWEHLVDVVDDYFRIAHEQRVQHEGDLMIEGTIETFPLTGATILEPWRKDSVDHFARLESTLQSIRRIGHFRVIPTSDGYLVQAEVFKELEDLHRPEESTSGSSTLRHDQSLDRIPRRVGGEPLTLGWIPQGRDVVLEEVILGKLRARLGTSVL